MDRAAWRQAGQLAKATEDRTSPGQRARVAETFSVFATYLWITSEQAPDNLKSSLEKWAHASGAVSRFVAEEQPRPGLATDFGPAYKGWLAAQKDVEAICGHPLPRDR
ncbi:MAG TPA: hypothetical protein VF755_04380 [Catenuloplanes sp.]